MLLTKLCYDQTIQRRLGQISPVFVDLLSDLIFTLSEDISDLIPKLILT